jgi:parvulin-like peptidyl-prolyl isomerase
MAEIACGNPIVDVVGSSVAVAARATRATRRRHPATLGLAAVLVGLVAVLVAAGCGGASPAVSPSNSAAGSSAVVARVDGDAVTRGEVERAVALSRLSAKPLTFKQALEVQIRDHLLQREAARLHVTVGDGAVAARLAQVEASLGGRAALQSSLSSAGLSLDSYRQVVHDGLLAEAVGARKFPAAAPTQKQVLAFYRAHSADLTTPAAARLAEIVVKTKSLGRAVIDRLRLGYSFAEVARAYSMNPESAAPGGVIGWVATSTLPSPLAHAVATARRGAVVGPFEAVGVWHVLKVLSRRAAHTRSLAAARPAIVTQLTTQRQATLLSAWLARARAAAHVTLGS